MSQTTTKSHKPIPSTSALTAQSTPAVPTHQPQSEGISLSSSSCSNHQLLTDVQLLRLCTHYGTQAKLWKQKFLGLLPEVEKRKLYLEKGCSSLFEFGAKLGGVSREQVLLVLRLEKRFEQVPQIQAALTSGSIPLSKLSRVASVVTPETQEFWLNQSTLLSKTALETLVKDAKVQGQPVPGHASNPNKTEKVPQSEQLQLSPKMRERLLALQNKGINLEELMEEFLNQREERIQQEKHKIAEELSEKEGKQRQQAGQTGRFTTKASVQTEITSPSRYIPQKIKTLLKQEYGDKCAQEYCINKSTHTHHTRRFGLNPSHNPLFLAPLCTQHHEIAHALDVRVQKHRGREVTGPAMGTPRPSGQACVEG